MSYLDLPRINFSGRFFTNVSTINNTIANYNPNSRITEGWNPAGVALFKFDQCKVTGVQSPASDHSRLIGADVTTPAMPVHGKLVDLDPDVQMLSQVIGVTVNLATDTGAGFQGTLASCNFQDFWIHSPKPEGNAGASNGSVIYVSTLDSIAWSNADDIEALALLRDTSKNSQLAIRFTIGSYFFDPKSDASGYGRIIGSIGPLLQDDPAQFVRRRLIPPAGAGINSGNERTAEDSGPAPTHAQAEAMDAAGPALQAANLHVDVSNTRLSVDLVNSIPLQSFGGPPRDIGKLRVVILTAEGFVDTAFAPFNFTDDMYNNGGGIIDVDLSPEQSRNLGAMQAGIQSQGSDGGWALGLIEHASGKYANITPFTTRAVGGAGDVRVEVRAFHWGAALVGEVLELRGQASIDQESKADPEQGTPRFLEINGYTGDGFAESETDRNGVAVFMVKPPAHPVIPSIRKELDSLVYQFSGPWVQWGRGVPIPGLRPAALLVWAPFPEAGIPNPTWEQHVQPIFDEYMRIYPGMKAILDLTSLETVQANRAEILHVFSLGFDNPHTMPVTRDLSPQKIELIKAWLQSGANDGQGCS